MKTATKRAQSYELCCPYCGVSHESANGTWFWTRTEIELAEGKTQRCGDCDGKFKLPKI